MTQTIADLDKITAQLDAILKSLGRHTPPTELQLMWGGVASALTVATGMFECYVEMLSEHQT
jgi:hypothetical protein